MDVERWRLWSYVLAGTAGLLLVASIVLLAWRPHIVGCGELAEVHPKCKEQVVSAVFMLCLVMWVVGLLAMLPALWLHWNGVKTVRAPAVPAPVRDARAQAKPPAPPRASFDARYKDQDLRARR